jgi:hypothetical protein
MIYAVSDFGDLLVLLHGARGRISTVRATVRSWRDVRRMAEAFERSARRGSVVMYAPGGGPEAGRESVESVVRVWLAPPDRAREEHEGADGEWFGVRRGPLWWHYSPSSGTTSNEHEPEVGGGIGEELWWLLDPAPLMGFLDFDSMARGRQAERAALRVRAVPRDLTVGDAWPLFRLGADGADELLLDVDDRAIEWCRRGPLMHEPCASGG